MQSICKEMLHPTILTSNLTLKSIFPTDVTEEYLSWLKDPRINRYMEFRHTAVNLQKQKHFIEEINASQDSCIFGIFLDRALFVGTIKVGPISSIHLTADIGILIGAVEHHGKGIGTSAIGGLCAEIGETLSVRKVNAAVIATNFGSLRAFEKNSFTREGLRLKQYRGPDDTTEDEILLGKIL